MNFLARLFQKVTYSCTHCNAVQRIPVRRIHFFERFHGLDQGQPVLIQCPKCRQGIQCPSPYRSISGHQIGVDPGNPPDDAYVHAWH